MSLEEKNPNFKVRASVEGADSVLRLIATKRALPGMVLARPIYYGPGGVLLLRDGMELTQRYIDRLLRIGVIRIYIKDPLTDDIEVQDVVSEGTRLAAMAMLQRALHGKRNAVGLDGISVDMSALNEAVDMIIGDVASKERTIVSLLDLKSYDDYTFGHSVNSTVLAMVAGLGIGYDEMRLRRLGLGMLLHDIGKTKVPREILNKPGKLDPWEFEHIMTHPERGYHMLQEDDELPPLSRIVCLQHHERCDGSGYPAKLMGDEIHPFSKVAAVVDVYDALTSDRVYRRAFFPYRAISYLQENSGRGFDAEVTEEFLGHIAPYPIGSVVELSDGSHGIVVRIDPDDLYKPTVRLTQDAAGRDVLGKVEIDLTCEAGLRVVNVVCD